MKLTAIIQCIEGEIVTGIEDLDFSFRTAFCSDLMSDVLAYVEDDTLLITGLLNTQVIRTCEMLDIKVIVFTRGKKPNDEVIEMASEKGVVMISTKHSLFTTSGKLFELGLRGIQI